MAAVSASGFRFKLRLLGIDHERGTDFYQGRRFRLTDVHGKVVEDLMA